MSDHVEIQGKKYYEESYLRLANNNTARREKKLIDLRAQLDECQREKATALRAADELIRINGESHQRRDELLALLQRTHAKLETYPGLDRDFPYLKTRLCADVRAALAPKQPVEEGKP